MNKPIFTVLGVLLVLSVSTLWADATADQWVRGFIKQRDAVKDFEADITTTIESAMFTEAQVQNGHLLQKGNDYRKMVFKTPQESTSIMTPKEFITIDALGNVSRYPNDKSAKGVEAWLSGSDPEAIFDQVSFRLLSDDKEGVKLSGTPKSKNSDTGFSTMEATFSKNPTLLKKLDLFTNNVKGLSMNLDYTTVDGLPVLKQTVINVEMQPPGAKQAFSLKTTVTHSNIKVNHDISTRAFEVSD